MTPVKIRPSLKFIQAGYGVAALFVVAAFAGALYSGQAVQYAAVSALILLWPAGRHIRRSLTHVTIEGDKLRYEQGLLSKTTRTIQLSKIQDVTVRQRLSQRIFGVGDLSIETAGETSRLTLANIDSPQAVADQITEISQGGAARAGR